MLSRLPEFKARRRRTETLLTRSMARSLLHRRRRKTFRAEQASLQTLELKNQTAIGNLQAVQVSNEIALAQVQQVQLLRQLVIAEMNSQNVAAANQVNNQVQSNLEAQAFFSAPPPSGTPDLSNDAAAPPQP